MNQDDFYDAAYGLFEDGEFGKAIAVLQKGHKRYPHDTDIMVLLAGCYNNICHFIDAARILLKAESIKPDDSVIKYNLGYSLVCAGRVADSMKYFEESLKLNPTNEVKTMATKMIQSRQDFEKKAENNYPISLEDEFECYDKFLEAQKLLYTDRVQGAILLYNEILSKKPDHQQTVQNIGVCYIKLNQPEKALAYLEKAHQINPKDSLCLGNLAYAYFKLGNKEKSEQYLSKMTNAINNLSLRDLIRILALLIEINQFSFARKLIEDFNKNSEHPQIDFLSGVVYAKQKEYAKAKKEFFKVKRISSTAKEYCDKIDLLIKGALEDYDFEPKVIVDTTIEVI